MFSLLLSLAGCGGAEAPAEPPLAVTEAPASGEGRGKRSEIEVAKFVAVHRAGANLLDVRTPAEYAEGHVPGALNMPVDTLDPAAPLPFNKSDPVYLICATGARSGQAANMLAANGWNAINVQGGTMAWRAAGLPLE